MDNTHNAWEYLNVRGQTRLFFLKQNFFCDENSGFWSDPKKIEKSSQFDIEGI